LILLRSTLVAEVLFPSRTVAAARFEQGGVHLSGGVINRRHVPEQDSSLNILLPEGLHIEPRRDLIRRR
jgi:hypothetical protein